MDRLEKLEIITDQSILTRISTPCGSKNETHAIKDLLTAQIKLLHGRAAGMAAIQIGIPRRIFVINLWGDQFMTFVNPELRLLGLPFWSEEGCLSIPGKKFIVQRYPQVICETVDFDTLKMKEVSYFHSVAVTIQHEFDHLNGVTLLQKEQKKD